MIDTRPDLTLIIQLHKKYHGRLDIGRLRMARKRPSMGDRMDNAAAAKERREQTPAEEVIEKAERLAALSSSRRIGYKVSMRQKYEDQA